MHKRVSPARRLAALPFAPLEELFGIVNNCGAVPEVDSQVSVEASSWDAYPPHGAIFAELSSVRTTTAADRAGRRDNPSPWHRPQLTRSAANLQMRLVCCRSLLSPACSEKGTTIIGFFFAIGCLALAFIALTETVVWSGAAGRYSRRVVKISVPPTIAVCERPSSSVGDGDQLHTWDLQRAYFGISLFLACPCWIRQSGIISLAATCLECTATILLPANVSAAAILAPCAGFLCIQLCNIPFQIIECIPFAVPRR